MKQITQFFFGGEGESPTLRRNQVKNIFHYNNANDENQKTCLIATGLVVWKDF